jgi:hypothetical protein
MKSVMLKNLAFYKIIPELKLIVEFATGKLDYEIAVELKRSLIGDQDYNENYNFITILHFCEINYTKAEIAKYKSFLTENNKVPGKRRSALLTNTPNNAAFSVIYRQELRNFPMRFEIFTTLKAALNWLQIPLKEEKKINELVCDWIKIAA